MGSKFAVYAAFIGITLFVGLSSGFLFQPGEWYAALNKPSFTPPGWLFGPVWTVLYILIGVAGAKAWLAGLLGGAFLIWVAQLALNALWSFFFFGQQNPSTALVDITLLLGAVVSFIMLTRQAAPLAAILFVPYACWVAFALVLNLSIVWLN